jgi:hypothetical protein
MAIIEVSEDGAALTIRVPMSVRSRGGRKLVISSAGEAQHMPARPRIDCTLVKLVARAHRWKFLLDSGVHSSLSEIAAAENISQSYVARVLQFALLSPVLVEAIIDGRQPATMTSGLLLQSLPSDWIEQALRFKA